MGDGEVEVVNVVLGMPHLAFVEIAQGVAHGTGGVGSEVAFGRIEMPGRMGECLLGRQFDLGMGQAGDVIELPGDFGRKGKELVYPCFHACANLSGKAMAKQVR